MNIATKVVILTHLCQRARAEKVDALPTAHIR